MRKLDQGYDSKSTASKIAKMSELVSIRYTNLGEDLSHHIDRMAGLLDQLKSLGNYLDDALSIRILVDSIEVSELQAVTAAIKTQAETDIKWEEVTGRLLEERLGLLGEDARRDRANPASASAHDHSENGCAICDKTSHETKNCFLNPLNPTNKLGLSTEVSEKYFGGKQRPKGTKKGKKNRCTDRSAVARVMTARAQKKTNRLMLDSGCTSHMTPKADRVSKKEGCNHTIKLADESSLHAKEKSVRTVNWKREDGVDAVHLSETLVARNSQ